MELSEEVRQERNVVLLNKNHNLLNITGKDDCKETNLKEKRVIGKKAAIVNIPSLSALISLLSIYIIASC